MARRSFIAIVGHGPDLERDEGAASVLRSLGADVRTLDLWDDPPRLFVDDETWASFRAFAHDLVVPAGRLVGLVVEREARRIERGEVA